MSEPFLCRLCANLTGAHNSGKIFERSRRKLLRQIADLTGLQLRNVEDLPQHICKPCEDQTLQAHRFRECCIRTQKLFALQSNQLKQPTNTNYKKLKLRDAHNSVEEQLLAIEEVVLADINKVKVEEKKEDEDDNDNEEEEGKRMTEEEAAMPNLIDEKEQKEIIILPNIAEVLLKGEPIESEDSGSADSASDCGYNPLNEKHENSSSSDEHSTTSDQSEFLPLEPEISLVTEEQSAKEGTKKLPKQGKSLKKISMMKENPPKMEKPPKEKKRKRKPKLHNLICDQCGEHFKCPRKLGDHLLRHAGDKPHQCKLCPQRFYSSQALKRHTRTHNGDKPFGCRFCDSHFMDDSSRIRHERVHTNTRPFACSICKKAFITNYKLKDHMVIHSGERVFKCPMCSVSFSRKTHLTTHYRSMTHKQNEEKHHKFLNQTVTDSTQDYSYAQSQIVEPAVETTSFL